MAVNLGEVLGQPQKPDTKMLMALLLQMLGQMLTDDDEKEEETVEEMHAREILTRPRVEPLGGP